MSGDLPAAEISFGAREVVEIVVFAISLAGIVWRVETRANAAGGQAKTNKAALATLEERVSRITAELHNKFDVITDRQWQRIDETRRAAELMQQILDRHEATLNPTDINTYNQEKAATAAEIQRIARDLDEVRELVLIAPARRVWREK